MADPTSNRQTIINLVNFRVKQTKSAFIHRASHVFYQNWKDGSFPERRWESFLQTTISNLEDDIQFIFQWERGTLLTDKILLADLSVIADSLIGTARYKQRLIPLKGRVETTRTEDNGLQLQFTIANSLFPSCFLNKTVEIESRFFDNSLPNCPQGSATYTVQSGDNCTTIVDRYSMKLQQLISANDIDAGCTNLQVGQTLCLPGVAQYSIVAGDTCSSVATRFQLSLDEFLKANAGIQCDNLQIKDTVVLPNTSLYFVQQGNTCFSIAEQFSLSLEQLQNANQGISCDSLSIGQQLYIPLTTQFVVNKGSTCFTIVGIFNITQGSLLKAYPNLNCDQLQVGQILYIPLAQQTTCSPTAFPNPATPDTLKPPIVGFWYISSDASCVQGSQVTPPTPSQATLSCFFDFYTLDFATIDMKNYTYPCFQGDSFSGGLSYNNYFYKCYCLGNGSTSWNVLIETLEKEGRTQTYIQNIENAGYNSIMLDIEQSITSKNFNILVQAIKETSLKSFLYSFQYGSHIFTEPASNYQFSSIDFGMPSVYGNCNTATLCDELAWWIDQAKFTPPNLVLGIIIDTWDTVQNYKFGQGTVGTSSFAGYCEWNYNLFTSSLCKSYVDCSVPDPC